MGRAGWEKSQCSMSEIYSSNDTENYGDDDDIDSDSDNNITN